MSAAFQFPSNCSSASLVPSSYAKRSSQNSSQFLGRLFRDSSIPFRCCSKNGRKIFNVKANQNAPEAGVSFNNSPDEHVGISPLAAGTENGKIVDVPELEEKKTVPRLELNAETIKIPYGNREITLETGRIGRQAGGAVMVTDGETMVYSTACASEDNGAFLDFVPLSVLYQERFSAAGRTSGSFFRREAKPRDQEVLVSRLIDRPIRPMFEKGFSAETQLLLWVLSYDGEHSPDALAITAAGASLAISDIPLVKPVAGVRVGLIPEKGFVLNPTVQEMERSKLDLVMAGTDSAVLMIEGYCDFLSEEELLEAVRVGQEGISVICEHLASWAAQLGKPKNLSGVRKSPDGLLNRIQAEFGEVISTALREPSKQLRQSLMAEVQDSVIQALSEGTLPTDSTKQGHVHIPAVPEASSQVFPDDKKEDLEGLSEDGDQIEDLEEPEEVPMASGKEEPLPKISTQNEVFDLSSVKMAFKQACSHQMRMLIVKEGLRSDGRGPCDVRPIHCSSGILPRVHGSALFTRGETQAIAVTTLGGDSMSQKLDGPTTKEGLVKKFYLQYTFPPCSVGEVGRMAGVSRREIGHGTLAERALEPCLPSQEDFPYVVRVESTITESNGSSSMATVGGGYLSLLDAGVPVSPPVAGVAMGLILNKDGATGDSGDKSWDHVILTDILGSEDALGDMDFKVAGSEDGVTAFQMDIKVEGITIEVMRKALQQAKEGRRHILGEMAKCTPPPSRKLSPYAPRIHTLQVRRDKVRDIIGQQGKTIRSLIETCGVDDISVEDSGKVVIFARNEEGLQKATKRIEDLTAVPILGTIYRNCAVKGIATFGAFVEILPGQEALCHISELNTERVAKVEDVLKDGDFVDVKLIEINQRGQLKVSRKAVLAIDNRAAMEKQSAAGQQAEQPST